MEQISNLLSVLILIACFFFMYKMFTGQIKAGKNSLTNGLSHKNDSLLEERVDDIEKEIIKINTRLEGISSQISINNSRINAVS